MINVPFKVACSRRKEDQFVSLPKATFGMGDKYLKGNWIDSKVNFLFGHIKILAAGVSTAIDDRFFLDLMDEEPGEPSVKMRHLD